jgi:hypothetical protein
MKARHIIALPNNGPKVIFNVIDLCANHHLEAQHGDKVKTVNAAMSETLK